MPSVLLGNISGGVQIIASGYVASGRNPTPVTGIQLRYDKASSGNAYVAYSGGVTVASGGYVLSGGGFMDGMLLTPGDTYFVPKAACGLSGNPQIFVATDPAASGFSRMYYEFQ